MIFSAYSFFSDLLEVTVSILLITSYVEEPRENIHSPIPQDFKRLPIYICRHRIHSLVFECVSSSEWLGTM